jgi:hypothetical protein
MISREAKTERNFMLLLLRSPNHRPAKGTGDLQVTLSTLRSIDLHQRVSRLACETKNGGACRRSDRGRIGIGPGGKRTIALLAVAQGMTRLADARPALSAWL